MKETKGNSFGGFTSVERDSDNRFKVDWSEKSVLFTLTNPHNVAVQRFAWKPENNHEAICCSSNSGPC
jgi:hypothetical protein